jgi:dynein light chain Tctex-type 1
MEDFASSEETAFIAEQIEPLLIGVVEGVLKEEVYDDEKTQQWIDTICDGCMKVLVDQNKPFKYTVSALIMQRNGAGVHHIHTSSWDAANDNAIRVIYPPPGQREQKESHL